MDIVDEQQLQSSCVLSELISADVAELIFARLPVKSLFRFKSVAKSWNHTISVFSSNRHFLFAHRHHSKINLSTKNMFLALRSYGTATVGLSKMENNELKPLQVELHCSGSFIKRVESCDGLILILWMSRRSRSIYLWNPSARTFTNLGSPFPDPDPRHSNLRFLFTYHRVFTCGIGFDPISKDYKIVATDVDMKQYTVFNNKSRRWNELKNVEVTIGDDIRSFSLDGHICLEKWARFEN
ncbi:putative F-box/kelch-repeat protein At1g12870 isoform X2 [Andrographis paniculata]|uniref:putative F-box/kelch-repeat protein At1g12870 isoform X2 n=1 Tax=Andrographis paniculata TaxID=175694 RepID=UPI0021E86E66|nr:putative F-box/kelch-repeat protein At1g12870 isoform X2 [Andrographis paniculata]